MTGQEHSSAGPDGELARLRAEVAGLSARLDALTAPSPRFAALYRAFEDRFRGPEADVRDRLAIYLPRIRDVAGGGRVLDVGPGRGEWLALLGEHGIPAYGVEANATMVERLSARDVDVVAADALQHLGALPAGELDAVTAFHVVEHLDLDDLLGLLAAAARALRPGGLLVVETPDPTNLVMGACNFRFDPTHRHPLPPALTEFLVAASGFTGVEVWKLHPKEDVELAGLRLDGVDDGTTALLAQALAKGLFGPQDYAILGHAAR